MNNSINNNNKVKRSLVIKKKKINNKIKKLLMSSFFQIKVKSKNLHKIYKNKKKKNRIKFLNKLQINMTKNMLQEIKVKNLNNVNYNAR